MGGERAALVTGGAARIGLAISSRLAASGYAVALHASSRSRQAAEAQVRALRDHGVRCGVVIADLADADACARLATDAVEMVGTLDLLVNNAAVFEPDSIDDLDPVVWDRQFAVNLRAPVVLSRAFAAQAQPGADASIVNLIDQRVLRPTPQEFSYTLSKSALWAATQMMAQAFAGRGIRVNAVGPGPVLPNQHAGDAGFMREVESLPLHRAVNPAEIAEAVLYLAGASSVTGQIIAVDSGQHLGTRGA